MTAIGSSPRRGRNRQLQLCVVRPRTHREEHAVTFTQSSTQTTSIARPHRHAGAEHDQIDGIEKCGDDGSRLVRGRCCDNRQPFHGNTVVHRRSETQRRGTDDNRPCPLRHSVGQRSIEKPTMTDLGYRAPPNPPEREERSQISSDRQHALDADPATGATDQRLKLRQGGS